MHTLIFKPEEIPFNSSSFRKYLRISNKPEIPEYIQELSDKLYYRYLNLAVPVAKYCIIKIINSKEDFYQIVLENNILLQGKGIYKLLKHCDHAVIYCLTIGRNIEEAISQMQTEDLFKSYILDSIASTLVSGLQKLVENDISQQAAKEERKLTKQFSPGYAGWKLEEQKKLFDILNSKDIGIYLTQEYYMQPGKSLSGIFGFFK